MKDRNDVSDSAGHGDHTGSAPDAHSRPAGAASHRRTAIVLSSIVVGMIGMSYAAVPLYQLFCQTTGYGGTPKIAEQAPDKILDRTIKVRLDANVAKDLPWKFEPKQNEFTVRLGETILVHYQATNIGTVTTRGTASYNVSPDSAGAYFNKIACFCFTEQKLEPGQSVDMPVTFFIDPALIDDRDTNRIPVITLSYTFHAMDKPAADAAALPGASREPKGNGRQG